MFNIPAPRPVKGFTQTGTEQLTHPPAAHSPLQELSAESQLWCALLQGVQRATGATVFLKHLLVREMDYNQGQQ